MKLDLADFKELIKQHCGLELEGNHESKLTDALKKRIAATSSRNASEYYSRLYGNEDEFQHLVNLLTINETYFFREPEQLRLLTERLVPRLLARQTHGQPLRILSAGCSSGEEPYSILMALCEKYGESMSRLFAVAGGDIDTQVLSKARAGIYGEFSFRGVTAEIKTRYFERKHSTYVFKESLRRQVEFHELNLLAEEFPAALRNFDIIFLRNVSIYFDLSTRRVIQQNLAGLLKDDGYLVIGTAETLANDLGVLALTEQDGLFYFSKQGVPLRTAPPVRLAVAPPPPAMSYSPPAPATPAPQPEQQMPATLAGAQKHLDEKRYDQALDELNRLLARESGNTAALLLTAHILLNRKEFAAAQRAAERVLESEPWSVDAFFVLGLVAKWREQNSEAVRRFKQAVYARHECWPARYYLAELYRTGGESEKARREYRGVQLAVSQASIPDTGIKIIPLGLPIADVKFLCEHQLSRLDNQLATLGK